MVGYLNVFNMRLVQAVRFGSEIAVTVERRSDAACRENKPNGDRSRSNEEKRRTVSDGKTATRLIMHRTQKTLIALVSAFVKQLKHWWESWMQLHHE